MNESRVRRSSRSAGVCDRARRVRVDAQFFAETERTDSIAHHSGLEKLLRPVVKHLAKSHSTAIPSRKVAVLVFRFGTQHAPCLWPACISRAGGSDAVLTPARAITWPDPLAERRRQIGRAHV